jgi:hypothetical protein
VSRPEKILDLMNMICTCIEEGRYLDTRHAWERQDERRINRPEILYVLKHGHHEKNKDSLMSSTIHGTTLCVARRWIDGSFVSLFHSMRTGC